MESVSYHIIHDKSPSSNRRVRCYETGRYHRHQTHVEEFIQVICGKTIPHRRHSRKH